MSLYGRCRGWCCCCCCWLFCFYFWWRHTGDWIRDCRSKRSRNMRCMFRWLLSDISTDTDIYVDPHAELTLPRFGRHHLTEQPISATLLAFSVWCIESRHVRSKYIFTGIMQIAFSGFLAFSLWEKCMSVCVLVFVPVRMNMWECVGLVIVRESFDHLDVLRHIHIKTIRATWTVSRAASTTT